MHQIVATRAETSRRWWVLAIVVAAQFMFGVDAFIVNVAIPTIATELHATPARTGRRRYGIQAGPANNFPSPELKLVNPPAGKRLSGTGLLRCRRLPAPGKVGSIPRFARVEEEHPPGGQI